MTAKPLPVDYQTALEGAAWYAIPQPGCVLVRGRDQVSFLQRQTTNDVRLLADNRALLTVLTSPNARILDVLYLISESNDAILALTLPNQGSTTAAYFKKRIFFMDQVEVEEVSSQFTQIDLVGPGRTDIIRALGFIKPPQPDEVLSVDWEGQPIRLLSSQAPVWLGWRLLIPAKAAADIQAVLRATNAPELAAATYHLLHLETGTPQAPSELNEDYTPLETGLITAISDAKGCYTGQEVIARQINYDKITQHLCGLRFSELPPSGASVWMENRAIGRVTSAGSSPRFGPIGLAVIKRPHFEPGAHVQVGNRPEQSQPAIVSPLPFY